MRLPVLLTILAALGLAACGDDTKVDTTPLACPDSCATPPANVCADAATLRVFAGPGSCQPDLSCTFATADVACPLGCDAGACALPEAPCAGVTCDTPPACHGAGQCVAGDCVYAPLTGAACDDGDPCTAGDSCQSGVCQSATPKVCDSPPAPSCFDDNRLSVASNVGVCQGGECLYEGLTVVCALGCAGGACVGDPCAGVSCTAPPSACHAPVGLCTGGTCDYAIVNGATCDDGDPCTSDDRCRADASCRGAAVACTAPPASFCADGAALTVFPAQGSCGAGGACQYLPQVVPCAHGCAADACQGDPCAGVTCASPPSPCHEATGTCEDGVCSYAFDDGAACDDGDPCTSGDACASGACDGEPIACALPPANSCADANTVLIYAANGQCGAAGACTYASQTAPCAHGCAAGACLGDPCANVICATPPAAACTNGSTLTTWSAAGTCSGGACSYTSTATTCYNGCSAAACQAPTGFTLSEVLVDSAGFPDTDAFVELHGPPGAALNGVSLVGVNGAGGAVYVTIPLSGNLDSAGLYVIAHPGAAPWVTDMADVLDAKIDLQNGPDSVQLRFGATVLDALGYGAFTGGTAFAGEGTAHPVAAVGESLFRGPSYGDTNDNLPDFTAGLPTPGAPTPTPVSLAAALTVSPAPHLVGDVVSFDASASTGAIVSYAFDFGDGTAVVTGAAATATHSYDAVGTKVVTVTVSDAAGGTDVATFDVVVTAAVSDDPFDPGSCPGTPWTEADALARLGGQTSVVLASATIMERSRSCPGGVCGAWSAPIANKITYLTYSGGVTTRYTTLTSTTSLVLWNKSGAPKLVVRHTTSLSKYPTLHDKGLVFGFPPATIAYPTMRAYNYAPVGQYDYLDIENYIGRDAQISMSSDCVRFVSVLPNTAGPVTTEYVALYRF